MGVLQGKVCVVTGASRGLGETMSLGFAREGADLVLAARTQSDLDRVAAACREAGAPSVTVVPTDIAREDDVKALVDKALAEHGRLDVFVANAGTSYGMLTDKRYTQLHTYDLDIAEQVIRVNVLGTFLCLKHAIPAMPQGGSIITIGSETGRAAYPGSGIYAVSKVPIDTMTKIAAGENAEAGLRVNCLSPGGMVDTQLFGPNGMPEQLKSRIPPLPPEVIVPAAVWLASDDSKDVTGLILSGREFNATTVEELRARIATEKAAAGRGRPH